jgi:hypothetical protein
VPDVVVAEPVAGGDEDDAAVDSLEVAVGRPVVVGEGSAVESMAPSVRTNQSVPRSPMPIRPPTRASTRSDLWDFGFGMSCEIQEATDHQSG